MCPQTCFRDYRKRCPIIHSDAQTVTEPLTTSTRSKHAASRTFHLVEAAVEDPLHWIRVKRHPLDLAALVFVVEGHGFTGGCADGQRETRYTHRPAGSGGTEIHLQAS